MVKLLTQAPLLAATTIAVLLASAAPAPAEASPIIISRGLSDFLGVQVKREHDSSLEARHGEQVLDKRLFGIFGCRWTGNRIDCSPASSSSSAKPAPTSTSKSTSASSSAAKTTSTPAPTTTRPATTATPVTSTKTSSSSSSSSSSSTSTASTTGSARQARKTGPWQLADSYSGSTFFDKWNFWSTSDPTHGIVSYQNRTAAMAAGLAYVNPQGQAIIKVDDTSNLASGVGRPSVRLHSQNTYADGLMVFDVAHVPVGCAVWPALWSNGPNWPNGGEIDVFETVGDYPYNRVSLHTSSGCTIPSSSTLSTLPYTGTLDRTNCYAYAPNAVGGCSIVDANLPTGYPTAGSGFNARGGGTYAAQFDAGGVRTWFFPRGTEPADLTAGNPKPGGVGWPESNTYFDSKSCEYDQFFGDQTIIINTTLGGDWAGNTYGQYEQAGCPGTAASQVMTGANFQEAYFAINSVRVFRQLS